MKNNSTKHATPSTIFDDIRFDVKPTMTKRTTKKKSGSVIKKDVNALRKAIVMKEILDKPKALRR